MSQDEIFQKVTTTLVDALGVEEDEVTAEATLTGDLGAESIDFLDIVFRLEKNFGIKIPRGDLFPDEKLFSDPKFVANGKMTAEGLDELRMRMPYADINSFANDPNVQQISKLFTVEMIVRYIESKLAEPADA
ncbi:Acyl carrier protein [Planctomycetes bacterium Pan216]|uniref:Acyl carrier protein n=1 Tax=Kolteria novifilia TaxID=2527975 RepID=A0A518BAE5_9BACT|nr:Acyl carrier protein [Planctomycetes bacterium Pan216]